MKKTLESIGDYEYKETVFVFGDLTKYVTDLELYFRTNLGKCEEVINFLQRGLDGLNQRIEWYERDGSWVYWDRNNCYGYGIVEETNYIQVQESLEEKRNFNKKLLAAQKINHGKLMNILFDGQELASLNLTNYAYPNHVVRIEYLEDLQESIRMRVFFDESSGFYKNIAGAFANHANSSEGLYAECTIEDNVDEEILPLELIEFSGKLRRSKLRVKDPVFEVNLGRGKITYSYQFSKAELEMLNFFDPINCIERTEWLPYASNTWSPSQARKIIRNLFGILTVEDRGGPGKNWYSQVYVDSRNRRQVQAAIDNGGVFTKTIDRESLPVLAAIYDRTLELKERHGNGFYPRFTDTEVANKTGLSKNETRSHLNNLVGVLAPVDMPYMFGDGYDHFYSGIVQKFFIPKSRLNLAGEILSK